MNASNTMRPYAGALTLVCLAALSACGGGGDTGPAGPAGATGATGAAGAAGKSALVQVLAEPAGANCPTGGRAIRAGLDANANAALDDSEVASIGFVCNGTAGATGSAGADGLATLVSMSAEAAGSNCANGGTRISAGPDRDKDGVLSAGETSTTGFVCNGATGATGAAGADGLSTLLSATVEPAGSNCAAGGSRYVSGLDSNRNGVLDVAEVSSTRYTCNGLDGSTGATGAQGPAGPSGLSVLIATRAEAVGANCRYGGTRIDSGLDLNASGALDSGEITATSYVCNGAGVSWTQVSADAPAAANTGYITNGAARVVLTLPDSATVGDVVQATAAGTGGWKLATPAGQKIFVGAIGARTEPGASWSPGTAGACNRLASSASGNTLATMSLNTIRRSTDGGQNWTDIAPPTGNGWVLMTAPRTGNRMVAVAASLSTALWQLLVSSDAGQSWTPSFTGTQAWQALAMSGDGSTIAAATGLFNDGRIRLSKDGGVTWASVGPTQNWSSIAVSSDGSRLVATHSYFNLAGLTGEIWTSSDGGTTWTARSMDRPGWTAVAMSDAGDRMVAAARDGQLYLSSDAGATWTATESNRAWTAVTMSADGGRIVASTSDGTIVTSGDGGRTWTARQPAAAANSALVISADGSRTYGCSSTAGFVQSAPVATQAFTTLGTTGYLAGTQYESVTLQFLGSGIWNVLNFVGSSFEAQ